MFFITEEMARVNLTAILAIKGMFHLCCFLSTVTLICNFSKEQGREILLERVGAALLQVGGNHCKTQLSVFKTQVPCLLDWTERNLFLQLAMLLSAACQRCICISKKLKLTMEVHDSISDYGRLQKGSFLEK